MLPDTDVARARRWVESRDDRLPERARGQIRYELDVSDRFLTMFECRPPWRPDFGPDWTRFPIVRLHYTKAHREWAVYWRDRNLKFHRFDPLPASARLKTLLAAVDDDRSGIFWG